MNSNDVKQFNHPAVNMDVDLDTIYVLGNLKLKQVPFDNLLDVEDRFATKMQDLMRFSNIIWVANILSLGVLAATIGLVITGGLSAFQIFTFGAAGIVLFFVAALLFVSRRNHAIHAYLSHQTYIFGEMLVYEMLECFRQNFVDEGMTDADAFDKTTALFDKAAAISNAEKEIFKAKIIKKLFSKDDDSGFNGPGTLRPRH